MRRIYNLTCALVLVACQSEPDESGSDTEEAIQGGERPREARADSNSRESGAPERIDSVEVAISWYEQHRDGVAGQFAGERLGDQLFVVWAPRQEGAEVTQVSTYVRPHGLREFFLSSDRPIQSIDYGDGVMRHFGEVRLYEHNGTIAYFVVPDVIYSHGSNLQEVAELIREKQR